MAWLSCSDARGGISIKLIDGSEATEEHVTKTLLPDGAGWDIVLMSLYNPGGETRYEIYGTGGEVINSITIDVPCWTNTQGDCAPAGSPVFVWVRHGDAAGIQSVGRIIQTGDAETSLRYVEAKQDIGELRVEDIGEVYAGRDVIGPVIATTENNSVRGVFIVRGERDVLGDVKAANGRLGMVYAVGTIGKPWAPVSIESRYIFYELHSETAIYASVNLRVNGGDVGLWAFITPVFEGTVITPQLPTNIYEGRAALVEISDRFDGDLIIGRSFDDPSGYMNMPLGGFSGQIIFNADNEPQSQWSNPIAFGTEGEPGAFVLNGPGYPQPASLVGGGSIGEAPFRLHDEDSYPPNGFSLSEGNVIGDLAVRLRHYGPVTWTDDPVTIERRDEGSTGPFSPLSLLDFDISADAGDPNTLVIGKTLAGQGGFEAGYDYRIMPTTNLLSDVASTPAVQWEQPYVFTFQAAVCVGDANDNLSVDVGDLLLLLGYWGSSSEPSALLDLDSSGVVDVYDLLILLSLWGPCP